MHIGCRILQNRFLLNTDRDEIEILAYTGNFFPKIWVDKFKVQTLFNSKIVDKTHWDQRKMRAYFTIPFMKTRTRSHKCFSSPLRINPHSLRFYRVLFVVKTTLIEGRGRNNQFTILHGQIYNSINKYLNSFDHDCGISISLNRLYFGLVRLACIISSRGTDYFQACVT